MLWPANVSIAQHIRARGAGWNAIALSLRQYDAARLVQSTVSPIITLTREKPFILGCSILGIILIRIFARFVLGTPGAIAVREIARADEAGTAPLLGDAFTALLAGPDAGLRPRPHPRRLLALEGGHGTGRREGLPRPRPPRGALGAGATEARRGGPRGSPRGVRGDGGAEALRTGPAGGREGGGDGKEGGHFHGGRW